MTWWSIYNLVSLIFFFEIFWNNWLGETFLGALRVVNNFNVGVGLDNRKCRRHWGLVWWLTTRSMLSVEVGLRLDFESWSLGFVLAILFQTQGFINWESLGNIREASENKDGESIVLLTGGCSSVDSTILNFWGAILISSGRVWLAGLTG